MKLATGSENNNINIDVLLKNWVTYKPNNKEILEIKNIIENNKYLLQNYTSQDCWPSIFNPISEPYWLRICFELTSVLVEMKDIEYNKKNLEDLLKLISIYCAHVINN